MTKLTEFFINRLCVSVKLIKFWLYALEFSTILASGHDPKEYEIIDKKLRSHLKICDENSMIDLFLFNQKRILCQIPTIYPLILNVIINKSIKNFYFHISISIKNIV